MLLDIAFIKKKKYVYICRSSSVGGLTQWALGQCPGDHHFRGPTPTFHDNLTGTQTAAKIAFAQGPEGVSVRPSLAVIHTNTCNSQSKQGE